MLFNKNTEGWADLVCVRRRCLGRAASVFRRSAKVCKFEQRKAQGAEAKMRWKRVSEGAQSVGHRELLEKVLHTRKGAACGPPV